MKLGDGRKVTMHVTPECEERIRLHTDVSQLLAEWLERKDDVSLTPKNDPSYAVKVAHAKAAKGKLHDAERRLTAHALDHGCW